MDGIGYADAIAERKSRSEQAISTLATQKVADVKGGEKMTILSKDERQKIGEVIDYILAHQQSSVASIKTRFNLTDEEYDQISDLMMPAQRQYSMMMHFKVRLTKLTGKLEALQRKLSIEKEKFSNANAKRKTAESA